MQPFPLRRAGGLTKRWWAKGSNCWAVKGVSCQDPPTGPEWGMRSDEVALSSPAPSMVTPRRHLSQSLLPWPFCGYLFLFCVFPPDKPQCSGLQWRMGQVGRRYRRGSCQLIPLDINEEKGEVWMHLDTGMEDDVWSSEWVLLSLKCCFENIQGEKFKKFLLLRHVTG